MIGLDQSEFTPELGGHLFLDYMVAGVGGWTPVQTQVSASREEGQGERWVSTC